MKLIISAASPFVRKTRVVLRETGLLDRVEEVPVTTSPLASAPEVVAANPIGKIPALVRPDGPAIYDGRVITRYLNDLAKAYLYPLNGIWEVMTLEATADGIMDAAVSMTYEGRLRPESQQSPDWVEAQWEKADRAIKTINTRWMSHLSGPLNIGQIGVACALAYVDLRHGARDWRKDNAVLAEWFSAFAERPSMIETDPENS